MKTLHTIKLGLLALACAALAASCSREIAAGNEGDGTATVTFTMSVPAVSETRALSPADEGNVAEVDVLVFKSGKFDHSRAASDITAVSNSKKRFKVTLPEGTCDLVVLTNSRASLNALAPAKGANKADVLAGLEFSHTGKWTPATPIPMWGFRDGVTISQTTSFTDADAIKVVRMIPKIHVLVDDAAAGAANANFKLTSVRLYNYNTKGKIAPYPVSTYWDTTDDKAIAPFIPAAPGKVSGVNNPLVFLISQGTAPDATGSALLNTIYTFESAAGAGGSSLPTNTCLVIGGSYKGAPDETCFYRVDLRETSGNTITYLPLMRNYCYNINITKVDGPGKSTPEEAFNSIPVDFEATIEKWNESNGMKVDFDGEYKLRLTRDMILCGNEGSQPGTNIVSTITSTNIPAGLKVAAIEYHTGGSGWLDGLYAAPTATKTTDADGNDVWQTTITVHDIPAYTGATDREARLLITSGALQYEYRIVQKARPWFTHNASVYMLDGTLSSFDVDAMAGWDVEIKPTTNTSQGKTLVTRLLTQHGDGGTVTPVEFTTYDDVFSATRTLGKEEVTLTFTDPDGIHAAREVPLILTSGTMQPSANCYMVTDGNPVQLIPNDQIARAITGVPVQSGSTMTGQLPADWISDLTGLTYRAAVLWSDRPFGQPEHDVVMYVGFSPGSGIADSRLVVLPGAAEGNAVVIIYEDKDGNGKYDPNTDKIKWSWHVWNTSYVPSTKWMDRHLGAMTNAPESPTDNLDTHGLFYQWGRKDPHPSSGLTTHSGYIETNSPYYTAPGVSGVSFEMRAHNTSNNLSAATANPLLRYYAEAAGVPDWYTNVISTAHANLWGDSGNKTVYDPCPAGYRVPKNGEWGSTGWAASANLGRINNDYGGYYPYSGHMSGNSNQAGNIGTTILCWSATVYTSFYGYQLSVTSSIINPSYGLYSRADGMPVRCVAE